MHQQETDKDYLKSASEVPPWRYLLRERKPKEFLDPIAYQTLKREGVTKTTADALSRSDRKL